MCVVCVCKMVCVREGGWCVFVCVFDCVLYWVPVCILLAQDTAFLPLGGRDKNKKSCPVLHQRQAEQ